MFSSVVARMACIAVVVAAGLLATGTAAVLADPSADGPAASSSTPRADADIAIDSASSLPLLVAVVTAPAVATPDCFSCVEGLD